MVEMPSTVTRMLLNHFRWDKEKLMERYYDGDQEKLFTEARVRAVSLRSFLIPFFQRSGNGVWD